MCFLDPGTIFKTLHPHSAFYFLKGYASILLGSIFFFPKNVKGKTVQWLAQGHPTKPEAEGGLKLAQGFPRWVALPTLVM